MELFDVFFKVVFEDEIKLLGEKEKKFHILEVE